MLLKRIAVSAGASMLFASLSSQAATTHHRLVWDNNPATSAVIGFSPSGTSNSPYVQYGYSTDESQWSSQGVSNTQTFAGSLTSHFVRLDGLNSDSAVYYRVCDQDGCGQRFWFKTAPTDNSSFIAVAGGDTRTGWDTRRDGNTLISKIRPLFIMHGGDFTDANSASQMNQYLTDWALTFSSDTINGMSYKRIYPFIPTHGNHEDNDYRTLCRVFGADFDQDGSCTNSDTYGAFNVSPLLRVYTLNSQYKNSGWSSYASAMNNWLASDIASFGSSATWRFAQYHKPMFPHYTGKSENQILHDWWADTFYDYSMNLVVESDTHITKLTTTVEPSGSGFVSTTNGGTVYVGEGSWGAPARSANDAKSWTIDMASIQQFKVLTVTPTELSVRTAQFDAGASTLTLSQRANDPTLLPANVNWWHATGFGETVTITQDANSRSIIGSGGGGSGSVINASEDTFIASGQSTNNFEGSAEQLLADGSDATYGEMMTLARFDVSSIAACEVVTSASLKLNVFNPSPGTYGVYEAANSSWSAGTVTWSSAGGSAIKSTQLATFDPATTGLYTIAFGASGINAVNSWIQGANNGIVIASTGTLDGIDMTAIEGGTGPALELVLDDSGCGGTQPQTVIIDEDRDTTIASSQPSTNLNSVLSDIEADGYDSQYGEMMALIGFPVASQIPTCATVTDTQLILNIDNISNGAYHVHSATQSWTDSGATWNNVGGSSIKGTQLGQFTPSSIGTFTYSLNAQANAAVQGWLTGSNNGIVIASGGTSNGVIIEDGGSENPKLQVTYTQENCN